MADYTNLYAKCRRETGLTQETWAERLDVSVESVKAYELGARVPPKAVVVRMVQASGCQWLALRYLQETDEGLEVLPKVSITSLPMAVIALINKILAFADRSRDKQLLRIAEDGVIDETERPLFDEIVADLTELIGAVYQVKYAPGAAETQPARPCAAPAQRPRAKKYSPAAATTGLYHAPRRA